MSPGRCNIVESGGLEEGGRRSGSGKVKVGLGGEVYNGRENGRVSKFNFKKDRARTADSSPGVRRRGGVFGVLGVYRRKGNIRARGAGYSSGLPLYGVRCMV